VATAAGVSTSTVSRYLTRGGYVSNGANEAISRAIDELGYVRNMAASSLMTHTTLAVAFVVHEPESMFFKDPNISAMALGATKVLRPAGIQLVMIASNSDEDSRLVGHYLLGGHVDGIMLISSHNGDPLLDSLDRSRLPYVTAGRPGGRRQAAFVDIDNEGATREITDRMIESGRHHLLHVAGPQSIAAARDRARGFQASVASNTATGEVVEAEDFGFEGGASAMQRVQLSEIDCVVAASDAIAAGVMSVLDQHLVSVPGDISVVGFDDNEWAVRTTPRLTTVRQDPQAIGRSMASYLLDRITGVTETPRNVILPYEIVWRESAIPLQASNRPASA
jgi:DNA-binding LacI/PurR family transcriptional regulator